MKLMSDKEWKELYNIAVSNVSHMKVSPYITTGFVSSAIKSKSGKIYKGVCVDACCGLGICAERNAITTMLAEGDFEIDKVLTVGEDKEICQPCGACRELMKQIVPSGSIQIAVGGNEINGFEIATLEELMPHSWVKSEE